MYSTGYLPMKYSEYKETRKKLVLVYWFAGWYSRADLYPEIGR